MRLPNESQLSLEQKEVCYAPTESTALVYGPPGSGKTVVAIFRQNALKKKKQKVQVLVFNKVLSRYTAIDKTFYSWLHGWWSSATRKRFPMVEGYQCDFARAIELIKTEHRSSIEAKGNWGHLVIDEAQDFARDAHRMLYLVAKYFDKLPVKERPSILILADENQRLQEHHNSTLEEIEEAYLLGDNDIYQLRKNYRNTLEVANLAKEFYTGLPTGIPESPTRRGDKPKLIATKDLNDVVDRIERHVKAHENEEVGVLVHYDATRRKLFNRLQKRFEGTKVTVQTYSSHKKDPNNDAAKLHFDKKGTITVLCFASSKGLEFDTVFMPQLQEISVGDGNVMSFRMNMYVMISRARERLVLMASDPDREAPIWQHLPLDKDLLDT